MATELAALKSWSRQAEKNRNERNGNISSSSPINEQQKYSEEFIVPNLKRQNCDNPSSLM